MENRFFKHPILNSPYEYPLKHWELDDKGQPTQKVVDKRRRAEFITPIPKPRKHKKVEQESIVFDEGKGLSTEAQQYDTTALIGTLRNHIDRWRMIPDSKDWNVTPETAQLLKHWRHHKFAGLHTVILLDRVQKKSKISSEDARRLKKERLIEGRYPSVYVTASVAAVTGKRAEYIRNRPFDDVHYKKMVLEYIKKFKTASKRDIQELLMDKLSDVLTPEQKKNKIRNMLHQMAKNDGTITTDHKGRYAKWKLV